MIWLVLLEIVVIVIVVVIIVIEVVVEILILLVELILLIKLVLIVQVFVLLIVQLVVFIVGALASLATIRPIARRHLQMPARLRTGTAALVGARAVVVERVDAHGGRVRLGGEVWSARAFDESQVLEPGATVNVADIQGATALVYE
jgi:membrane protein implicated in regulation of membrane protease activity